MELLQSEIAKLYLFAFLLGFLLSLFFDLFRFPRLLLTGKERKSGKPPHSKKRWLNIVIFLEDFLFSIFASVCVILLFYEFHSGKIRPVSFAFLLGGLLIYRLTVGIWIRKLLLLFSQWIRFAVWKICVFLFQPIRKAYFLLKKRMIHLRYQIQNGIEKNARKRQTAKLLKTVERNAAGLLPGGVILKKKKAPKQRRTNGITKGKKNHCAKQKSVA